MDSIQRSVRDFDAADRRALEHVLERPLSDDQQVVIQVLGSDAQSTERKESDAKPCEASPLPEWCNVYEGLSDAEIADIESSIVRSPGSRDFQ